MMEPDPKEFDKLQKLLASKEKEKPEHVSTELTTHVLIARDENRR